MCHQHKAPEAMHAQLLPPELPVLPVSWWQGWIAEESWQYRAEIVWRSQQQSCMLRPIPSFWVRPTLESPQNYANWRSGIGVRKPIRDKAACWEVSKNVLTPCRPRGQPKECSPFSIITVDWLWMELGCKLWIQWNSLVTKLILLWVRPNVPKFYQECKMWSGYGCNVYIIFNP